jgi:uncharacterized membrane protein
LSTGGGRNVTAAKGDDVPERWPTSRTEAFSDGVFAIAITLLVLEIGVPESEFDNLWKGIAGEWPSYLAFATSFLTIGAIWLTHHGVFARMQYVDSGVMRLNILLLLAVSFLPFPTRLMAEAFGHTSAERAAVIFYGSTLLAISALLSALWGAVARDPHLIRSGVTEDEVRRLLAATTPSIGSYAAALVLAIFAPHIAAFGFFVVAIVLILRARGD